MRPLIKYPGGKAKVAEGLAKKFPDGACPAIYREHFLGSGAMFLSLAAVGRVSEAVLSDINPGVINFHTVVRDRPDDLLAEVARMPQGEDWRDHYYRIRAEFNATPRKTVAQAANLLWLNRTAFNGLYRENKSGGMNAPAGDYLKPSFPEEQHVRAVSGLLQMAKLAAAPAEVSYPAAQGDWVYEDPPYDPVSASSSFTSYSAGGFSFIDQQRLAAQSGAACLRGASVVASNAGTERMLDLWRETGFSVETFELKRSIGCTIESRGAKVTEMVAWRQA